MKVVTGGGGTSHYECLECGNACDIFQGESLSIEALVDSHYDQMFDWLCHNQDSVLHELLIEVKINHDGKTIRRSWRDREEMLRKENQ